MRKYEIFRKRGKRVIIEQVGSWVEITEETKKSQGYFETNTVRVPFDSLWKTLQAMNHEVKP